MSTPLVDIAVCGKFHYFNYVPLLNQRNVLSSSSIPTVLMPAGAWR